MHHRSSQTLLPSLQPFAVRTQSKLSATLSVFVIQLPCGLLLRRRSYRSGEGSRLPYPLRKQPLLLRKLLSSAILDRRIAGIACCICKICTYTVQIIGAVLIGHIILIICRKHGNQLTDTCHDLILCAGEIHQTGLFALECCRCSIAFILAVSVKCIRRIYKKLSLLALP